MPFAGHEDFDACTRSNSDKEDPEAYCAQVHYEVTGEWPAEKYRKQLDDVFETPIEVAEKMTEVGDVALGTVKQLESTADLPLLKQFVEVTDDARRVKEVLDMVKLSRTEDVSDVVSKADNIEKVGFDAEVNRSVQMVLKQDDDFLIWGPASVEVVDKEKDKISVDALDKALPQLLKRARLSYNHTDQIVGKILDKFETEESVEVTIDGQTYERSDFPTDVLELNEGSPALFVAGEVFDDTQQSQNVRKEIEEGTIDSYSISGEALVTQKQVDGNMVYDDILELDLSAVTLCEEGMNQEAKFARINGDVDSVETVDKYESEFDVNPGHVSDTEEAIAKSMSEEDNDSTEFNPDDFVKSDEVEGELASKEYVSEELEETVDKTVDAVVDELEGSVVKEEQFEEKAESVAKDVLNDLLPKGDLVTRSYVESLIEEKGDYEDDDEEMDEEEKEDYEEEEMPNEDDEEEMPEEMSDEKTFTRNDLEEELPGDVWSVVSEYVGDNKQEGSREKKSEESEEGGDLSDEDLEKAVRSVLKGEGVGSPGIGADDRENQLDEMFKDTEEGDEVETEDSPALDKWNQ